MSTNLTIEADGGNSMLDLSGLTNFAELDDGSRFDGQWKISASDGGSIQLSSLQSLSRVQNGYYTFPINFSDTGAAAILDGKLANLNGVDVSLDGSDAHVADSWTTLTDGGLTVTGGSYDLPGLSNIDHSSLSAESGAGLILSAVASYIPLNHPGGGGAFQADGTGSVLELPTLKGVSIDEQSFESLAIKALNGGKVSLTGLTSLSGANGSSVAMQIVDTGGGALLAPALTTLNEVGITLDGSDQQVAGSWTVLQQSALTLTGGAFDLSGLTGIDDCGFSVSNGEVSRCRILPALQSLRINVDGAEAPSNLPNLDSITAQVIRASPPQTAVTLISTLPRCRTPRILAASPMFFPSLIRAVVESSLQILHSLAAWPQRWTSSDTSGTSGHVSQAERQCHGGSCSLPNLTDIDGSNLTLSNGGNLAFPSDGTRFDSGLDDYHPSKFQVGSGSVLDLSALTAMTQHGNWTII